MKTRTKSRSSLFRQKRVGEGGKEFDVLKFRTMVFDAEEMKRELVEEGREVYRGKIRDDPRVIRHRWWMRRIHFDELPQLVNILKGEMKLVGLRAIPRDEFDKMPEDVKRGYVKQKPALMDVALAAEEMPETNEEVWSKYRQYLSEYRKNPLKTDLKYFLKILYRVYLQGHWGL